MKRSEFEPLSYFNDEQRSAAAEIYRIIEPNITNGVPLPCISDEVNIPLRTLERWKERYQKFGLPGLIRRPRSDLGSIKVDAAIQSLIENIRLNNRRISIATIHRKVSAQCNQQSLPVPSYQQVYKIVKIFLIPLLNWPIMVGNLIQKNMI
jgi:putative transposase